MKNVLNAIVIVAGIMTAFIGSWGFVTAGASSTAELQEMQFWISLALISGGIGLIVAGAAQLVATTARERSEQPRDARRTV